MIKLALIDNGIPYHMRNNRNQRIVHKSFLASKCDPSEYKDDKSFHGAVCVGIITSICSDIELWDLNVTDSAGTTQITVLLEALEWCIQNKIKLIHMSLGTINYFDIKPLWIQIKRLLDADAIIVAAYHNRNIKESTFAKNNSLESEGLYRDTSSCFFVSEIVSSCMNNV